MFFLFFFFLFSTIIIFFNLINSFYYILFKINYLKNFFKYFILKNMKKKILPELKI